MKNVPKNHENQKDSILKNVEKKKVGQTQKQKTFQNYIQITIFLHSLGCILSNCIIGLFRKILEQEIFQVKVGTHVGWTLVRKQLGNIT